VGHPKWSTFAGGHLHSHCLPEDTLVWCKLGSGHRSPVTAGRGERNFHYWHWVPLSHIWVQTQPGLVGPGLTGSDPVSFGFDAVAHSTLFPWSLTHAAAHSTLLRCSPHRCPLLWPPPLTSRASAIIRHGGLSIWSTPANKKIALVAAAIW
jgi:hypothetical protein